MNMRNIQLLAGTVSSVIFALASVNMLLKVWRTKDMRSYSLGQIVMNNIGNLIYWLYICGLPFGPVWLLHGFFTITSLLMLAGYFMYRVGSWARKTATLEIPPVLQSCECH